MRIDLPILQALPEVLSAITKTRPDNDRMQLLLREANEAMRSDRDPFPFLCELAEVLQNSLRQLQYAKDLVEGAETASAFWDLEIAQLVKGNSTK
jgi:hypothetical protein